MITSIIKYNKFFICSLSFIPSFTLFISKYILSFKNSLDGHIFLFYSKHSSFPSTHKYFVSHFDFLLHSLLFPIKKKKKSSPFLEQVKSFSQWFGINAIFHKNAIENRVLTDLAALDDARTRSFCFAIDSTNHWQRNGLDTVSRGVIHDAKAQFLRPGDDE